MLCNISDLYKGRLVEKICKEQIQKIMDGKPNILKDANIEDLQKPTVIHQKELKISTPKEIKITLIATPDMRPAQKALESKLMPMVDYYKNEAPAISICSYVQDQKSINTDAAFQTAIGEVSQRPFAQIFVALIGQKYGFARGLRTNTACQHPWTTNYRDRADWEILLRKHIKARCTGLVCYSDGDGERGIHPKTQTLVQELRGIKFIQLKMQKITDYDDESLDITAKKINTMAIRARKCFTMKASNVNA